MSAPDPVLLQLYRHRFEGVADEMGATLQRTSYSPNIKERLDFSCAVFDVEGGLVAQAAHIPVHLGAMPASVRAALDRFNEWWPGDVVLLNDPYAGGTHLPDVTMISPVFVKEQPDEEATPDFFVASRAHHADVGGMTPGSLPLANELVQEGLVIPPVKLFEAGMLNDNLQRLLLRNVRTPNESRGDLAAQRAAHAVGERRLQDLAEAHGADEVLAFGRHLQAYSERQVRAAIGTWPNGRYTFNDRIEVGEEERALLAVTIDVGDEEVTFDFDGTSPAVEGSLNAVRPITESACHYVVRCLTGEDVSVNGGCFAPVTVRTPSGSIVDANPPRAVAGGNVETSQRIVDVILGALAEALPDRVPAAGQGTMNNLTIGGERPDGSSFAYYETIGGGMGASSDGPGADGVHVHMTNTLNTPVEALEQAYPFRVLTYRRRDGSGGNGRHRGGDGLVRIYEMQVPVTVTMLSTRRQTGPWGREGGEDGAPGRNVLVHPDGTEEPLPGHFSRRLPARSRLRIETPGGGGFGAAD